MPPYWERLPGVALDTAWDDRCEDLARSVDRLSAIGSQDALILLRSSFSAPKVLHLLRCCPSADHPSFSKFDGLLRYSVQQITNSNLSEIQWIQASLPVHDGGQGIRSVPSLALSAIVASAVPDTTVLQAHCHSSPTSWLTVHSQTTISFRHTCQLGHHSLEMSQKSCQPNSHSGTDLVCWWIRHW